MILFWQSLLGALVLALVHLLGGRLLFVHRIPRKRWLSIAGGVAVAYALIHLLPEVQHYHDVLANSHVGQATPRQHLTWLLVLAGLVTFYGLEKATIHFRKQRKNEEAGWRLFLLHITSYALYNGLLGYLLVREDRDWHTLLLFVVGVGLHFVVNDHSLRHHYPRQYHRIGRWVLAAGVMMGWLVGVSTDIHPAVTASAVAFLGGGILLNTFKEELPEENSSRFWPFALGAFGYAAILLGAG